MNKDAHTYWLQQTPLFKKSSTAFLERLSAQSQYHELEKNQTLFISDEPAARFYLIVEGWIKLFRETLDGTQAIIDIVSQGHVFGKTSLFHGGLYPYSAESIEKTKLISAPIALLEDEIKHNPQMAGALLEAIAFERMQKDKELEHRTLQTAPERIGCFLLRLTDQRRANIPATINMPYDKTLIAARLGMQPETFSRALTKLKKETGISIKGATVEIPSIQKLSSYCCAACSFEFPCSDLAKKKVS